MQSKERAVIVGTYTQSSVRMRIEAFFLDNIGKVTTREQIMEVTQFYHRHLYVRFYLGRSEVHVGFIIIASGGKGRQDILEKQLILFERLKEHPDIEAALIPLYVSKANEEVVAKDAQTPFESDELKKFQWLDLRYKLPITALEDQGGVTKVLNHLTKMRNFINEVQLFPEPSEVSEAEAEAEANED